MLIGGNWLTQNLALKKVRAKYKCPSHRRYVTGTKVSLTQWMVSHKYQMSYKIYGNRYKDIW